MKTIKKLSLLFIFFIGCFLKVAAQSQIEIVIVGSNHDNTKSKEDFQAIINKLKNFKPDMVFGEFLPQADYATLGENHWSIKAFEKGRNYLQKLNPEKVNKLSSKIEKNKKALSSFAYYHQARMDLAVNYAKNWDKGNTEYQIFVLENYMKSRFGKEEQAAYTKMFGNIDSLKKYKLYRSDSEYTKIYFPLIYQLNQNQIYNMDCQTYEHEWNKAWRETDSLYKILIAKAKADPTSAEAATVKAINNYYKYTPEELKSFDEDSYTSMNTERYGMLDEGWNLYGGRPFYNYPGFPTQSVKEMIKQWTLRNEGMSKNILEQAKAHKARRIVVGVGASHRKWMEEILAKNPEVKIISYNTLQ